MSFKANSPSCMKFNREKVLLCVDYPAVVKNVDKMLETLGGEEKISMTYSHPTHRMALKFRPQDVHCKPLYGDKVNTTRILLKVKSRRKKNSCGVSSTRNVPEVEYHSEIVGIIDHTYKFRCMVDFQYLPMERMENVGYKSVVDQLVPSKLHPSSWFQEESPLFLTPIIFSRIDNPCDYNFRKDPKTMPTDVDDVISRVRQKRCGYTIFVNYDDETIPEKPHERSQKVIDAKFCRPELVNCIRKLFEERPIWTRNGLLAQSGCFKNQLKYILPAFAYYFLTGPWRALWVRFGYDPRKDPNAKIYQLLDFRIRKQIGREQIPAGGQRNRFYHVLPIKYANQSQAKTVLIQKDSLPSGAAENADVSKDVSAEPSNPNQSKETHYIFRAGVIPYCRQTFYQLCDVHLDEVQKLVHSNDGQEKQCLEKDGWCLPGIPDKCRDLMTEHVEKLVAAHIQENKETTIYDKDQSSDSDSDDPERQYHKLERTPKHAD